MVKLILAGATGPGQGKGFNLLTKLYNSKKLQICTIKDMGSVSMLQQNLFYKTVGSL
jgi:hypothetical protein